MSESGASWLTAVQTWRLLPPNAPEYINDDGRIPITVYALASSHIFWPMMEGSPLYRRFQKGVERMTVASASGRSSPAVKLRPRAGATPSVENRFHEHHPASICSGSFPPSPETLYPCQGDTRAICATLSADLCHSAKLPASTGNQSL